MLHCSQFRIVLVLTFCLCSIHGQQAIRKEKPVEGDVVERHPYSVSLRSTDGHVCSGILVGDYAVLTASQCVDSRFGRDEKPSLWLASLSNEVPSQDTVFRETVQSVRHPNFSLSDTSRYDIAVLTMNETARPLRQIRYLSWPYNTTKLIGTAVSHLGYGRTSRGSAFDADLRIGEADLLSPDRCLSVDINFSPDTMLCLSDPIVCRAEKGGPIFQDNGNPLEDILVGISSGTECFQEYELSGVTNIYAPDIHVWLNETIFGIEAARSFEVDNLQSVENRDLESLRELEEAVGSELSIEEQLDLLELTQELM